MSYLFYCTHNHLCVPLYNVHVQSTCVYKFALDQRVAICVLFFVMQREVKKRQMTATWKAIFPSISQFGKICSCFKILVIDHISVKSPFILLCNSQKFLVLYYSDFRHTYPISFAYATELQSFIFPELNFYKHHVSNSGLDPFLSSTGIDLQEQS